MAEDSIGRLETAARLESCWTTYVGAISGVLHAAGMTELDLTGVMALSGRAFHLVVHEQCCPSSVWMYRWLSEHLAGLDRIGVLSEVVSLSPTSATYEAACRKAVLYIRAAIDRGVGVVLWGARSNEFGVVYGYDDDDGVFLIDSEGRFEGPAKESSPPLLYENVGRSLQQPILHYQIPVEKVPFDLGHSYLESLRVYLRQTEGHLDLDPSYKSGLLAYDNWLAALEQSHFRPRGVRLLTATYAEAKRYAAEYARRLAADWKGLPGLGDVAALFERNAGVYDRMLETLGRDTADRSEYLSRPVSEAQARALVPLVREAKGIEAEAVRAVRQSLASSNARPDADTGICEGS